MKEIWLAGNNPEEGVAIKSKLLESSLIISISLFMWNLLSFLKGILHYNY